MGGLFFLIDATSKRVISETRAAVAGEAEGKHWELGEMGVGRN